MATESLERGGVDSLQWYEVSPEADSPHSALRRPVVHESAFKQATGEAVYTNDMAPRQGRGSVAVFIWASVCLYLCVCVGLSVLQSAFKQAVGEVVYTDDMAPRKRKGPLTWLILPSVCLSLQVCCRSVCPPVGLQTGHGGRRSTPTT